MAHVPVISTGWMYAKYAGINQGVIASLLACATVINTVVFYFAFKEKVTAAHIAGMV